MDRLGKNRLRSLCIVPYFSDLAVGRRRRRREEAEEGRMERERRREEDNGVDV